MLGTAGADEIGAEEIGAEEIGAEDAGPEETGETTAEVVGVTIGAAGVVTVVPTGTLVVLITVERAGQFVTSAAQLVMVISEVE